MRLFGGASWRPWLVMVLLTLQPCVGQSTTTVQDHGIGDSLGSWQQSRNNNNNTNTRISAYIGNLMDSYQEILTDVIEYQVLTWMSIPAAEGVPEDWMDSCPRVSPKNQTAPRYPTQDSLAMFEWDDEDDIPDYFDMIRHGCSRQSSQRGLTTNFEEMCWDAIKDLVDAPRCTTRFDSRVTCERGTQPMVDTRVEAVTEILERHFSDDTLNIVIIGGGPTGLFLANALNELNFIPDLEWRPIIRVVVLENRVEASGVKKAYQRNWGTLMDDIDAFVSSLDPQLSFLWFLLSNSQTFSQPIHVIETLLMMSSRRKGVKFIYETGDILSSLEDYLSTAPNLVVFDATGHRLESLSRGTNCPEPMQVHGMVNSVVGQPERIQCFSPRTSLYSHGHFLNLAEKGDLIYPVTKDGAPYATWWLHVNDAPFDEKAYDLGWFWNTSSPHSEFCVKCEEEEGFYEKERFACDNYCYLNKYFDMKYEYRDDIRDRIAEKDPWMATKGANMALTGQQAKILMDVISKIEYQDRTVGIPLRLLPLKALVKNEMMQAGGLVQALVRMVQVENQVNNNALEDDTSRYAGRTTLISLFQHRPYIYKNGTIKGSLFGSAPKLRIGDSLSTGDPNHGSGLNHHVAMVRSLVCGLRGLPDPCPYFSL